MASCSSRAVRQGMGNPGSRPDSTTNLRVFSETPSRRAALFSLRYGSMPSTAGRKTGIVMRPVRRDSPLCRAIAISSHQAVPVENASDQVITGDQHQLPDGCDG